MAAERSAASCARSKRFLGAPLAVVAVGLLMAACAAQTPTAPAAVQSTTSVPAPAPVQSTAAAPDPCALLSTVDRSTAGLSGPGKGKTIGPDQACDWTEPGTFGLTLTLSGSTPLSALQVPKSSAERLTVGRHRAIRVPDTAAGAGTCAVLLAAGENGSAQVDVTNSGFSDTALACRRANTVAELIEPKLP